MVVVVALSTKTAAPPLVVDRVLICVVPVTWNFVPETSTRLMLLPTPVVVTAVKVMLIGVRPAGPSMLTALAAAAPEVVIVPEVIVIVLVLFVATRAA